MPFPATCGGFIFQWSSAFDNEGSSLETPAVLGFRVHVRADAMFNSKLGGASEMIGNEWSRGPAPRARGKPPCNELP